MSKKKGIENTSPKFESAVFFVRDVEKSKKFYSNLLGQKITMDFGRNVAFEGGLTIWEADYALNIIFLEKAKDIKVGGNNSEIYFEISNLEELRNKLKNQGVEMIHPIVEAPWGQRSFRIYDPDNHIVEFGEPMSSVIIRLHQQGMSPEEINKKSFMPIVIIKDIIKNIKS